MTLDGCHLAPTPFSLLAYTILLSPQKQMGFLSLCPKLGGMQQAASLAQLTSSALGLDLFRDHSWAKLSAVLLLRETTMSRCNQHTVVQVQHQQ